MMRKFLIIFFAISVLLPLSVYAKSDPPDISAVMVMNDPDAMVIEGVNFAVETPLLVTLGAPDSPGDITDDCTLEGDILITCDFSEGLGLPPAGDYRLEVITGSGKDKSSNSYDLTIGAIGPTGADGADGATGSAGSDGVDGADGATGSAGSDGADGADGATGSDGVDGADGSTGPAGPIVGISSILSVDNSANSMKIIDVADPTNAQDVATKSYVDDLESKVNALELLFGVDETASSGGRNFFMFNNTKTSVQAQAWCENLNLSLAKIDDSTQNDVVASMCDHSNGFLCWIGLSDQATEGTPLWQDGTSPTYTNWYAGGDNNDNAQDCVTISGTQQAWTDYGSWEYSYCNQNAVLRTFICSD
jgi:hypothetical protein